MGVGLVDAGPLDLADFSVAPEVVDVSNSSAEVKLQLHVQAAAGNQLADGRVRVRIERGGSTLIQNFPLGRPSSGDAADGVYEVSITVPRHSGEEDWLLTVVLRDQDGTEIQFGELGRPMLDNFPDRIRVRNTGVIDRYGPRLVDVSLSMPQHAVGVDPLPVLTIDTEDPLSGLAGIGVQLDRVLVAQDLETAFRISGNPQRGRYRIPLDIPPHMTSGEKSIRLLLEDAAGNGAVTGFTASAPETAELSLTLVNDDPDPVDVPVVTRVSLEPSVVDVSGGTGSEAILEITAEDKDGVDLGLFSLGDVASFETFDQDDLIERTGARSTFRVVVKIPPGFPAGVHQLEVPQLIDELGNRATGAEIPGGPLELTVLNTGAVDESAPQVDLVQVQPTTIDISEGGSQVRVNLSITDGLAGMDQGNVSLLGENRTLRVGDRLSGDARRWRVRGDNPYSFPCRARKLPNRHPGRRRCGE